MRSTARVIGKMGRSQGWRGGLKRLQPRSGMTPHPRLHPHWHTKSERARKSGDPGAERMRKGEKWRKVDVPAAQKAKEERGDSQLATSGRERRAGAPGAKRYRKEGGQRARRGVPEVQTRGKGAQGAERWRRGGAPGAERWTKGGAPGARKRGIKGRVFPRGPDRIPPQLLLPLLHPNKTGAGGIEELNLEKRDKNNPPRADTTPPLHRRPVWTG